MCGIHGAYEEYEEQRSNLWPPGLSIILNLIQ